METLVVASLGSAFAAAIVVLFVHIRRRASTVAESDSSDDETSGPLSVNVVADHDEKDSLLPTFAGLLRSPWHGVAAGQKEQPKRMRPVRKGSLSLSLTMPLPLLKKRKPADVPTKKVHVPYFFPLLDETAEWWQTQQQSAEPQPTPEEEPETDPEDNTTEDACNLMPTAQTYAKELLEAERPHHFPAVEIPVTATPIEVGARGESSKHETKMVKEMPLDIGLRVDVLDDEGIWNTGIVADVGSEDDGDKVEIKYDGWGDDYNQWIDVTSQRLAPLHTYTIVKKCWAKLTKWPWWPAFVVLRAPTTALASQGLEEESKLYVEFYDSFNEAKRSRCWMQKKNVAAFRDGFEERASKNIGKNFPQFVEGTQRAKAGTSPLLFSGPGTLPIEYSSKMADPLEEKKKECTAEQWFHLYRDFSNRYKDLYGYTTAPAASSGKRTASSGPRKSGKRAPARSVTKVVKGEQSEDEDESEEKEEEPEADEPEESGDEEEEAPARRTSRRQNKRAAAPAPPARRSIRPRRVKVIEELILHTSSASSLSSPTSARDARSSSIARDCNLIVNPKQFVVKTEASPQVESKAQPTIESEPKLLKLPSEPDVKMQDDGQLLEECKPEAPSVQVNSECVGTSRRRKDLTTPPAKLSERIDTAKATKTEGSGGQAASEQDPDFYQDWSGGSRYEVDNKPWNILGWLVDGIGSRLQRK
uniref:PWWP domain-containing protein n=1 Tax=Phytophthora ramorum TaxID=164328 RepID=H3GFK8_PHYRM